jgi:CheY-like chemotaxis protein
MSLLGRLEDLSLTDIVQIVFLSRRTGALEIIDDRGRHTVLFRHGLIVNASSPESPDLLRYLIGSGDVPAHMEDVLRRTEESGIPVGTAILEMNVLSKDDLAEAIRIRITGVMTPLLTSREGEFNFILSESVGPLDVEYEPEALFERGGIPPQKIIGGDEKIKPLRGLEESLKAGKALLRGASSDPAPVPLGLGLGSVPAAAPASDNVVKFPGQTPAPARFDELDAPTPEDGPFPEPAPQEAAPASAAPSPVAPVPEPEEQTPRPRPLFDDTKPVTSSGRFKVAGGLIEVANPEMAQRNVVLLERNPLVRVAAKRAFGKQGVKITQYGSVDDVRQAIIELLRSNSFFVTFLELTPQDRDGAGPATQILERLKKKNRQLPVVMVDEEADLRRRHHLLKAGADLYLTKPTEARLQPGLAEEELALYADELVLFADRAFAQWQQLSGGRDQVEAGKRFYETGRQEHVDRSFGLLKQLINELSNPNDINQVTQTILRLSGEYLERGALFMAADDQFIGLGGFGVSGGGETLDDRARRIRIPSHVPSLLQEVRESHEPHRGKIRRTVANVDLIEKLGGILPTEVIALPIMHERRVIGILYGDNGEHRAPIDATTGLEIFLSQAGYAFGNAVFAWRKAGRGREGQ